MPVLHGIPLVQQHHRGRRQACSQGLGRPHQQALCHQGAAEITVRMRMGLPPQTACVGLIEGDPGIIPLPSLLLLWDEQRRRAAGGTCKSLIEMEICNYLGGWEAMGHQAWMGIQEKPFLFGWHPLPQECLVLMKVPQNSASWLHPGGCFGEGGTEGQQTHGLFWATPGACLIPQGRGGHSDGRVLPGHFGIMPSPPHWRWPQ